MLHDSTPRPARAPRVPASSLGVARRRASAVVTRVAAALAVALLGGCGDAGPDRSGDLGGDLGGGVGGDAGEARATLRRLDLDPAPGAVVDLESRQIALFDDVVSDGAWSFQAPSRSVMKAPGDDREDAPLMARLQADSADGAVRLWRPVSFDPLQTSRVVVTLTFRGTGIRSLMVAALLDADGRPVREGKVALGRTLTPTAVAIDMPLLGEARPCVALDIQVHGKMRDLGVLGVELRHEAPGVDLPDPRGPPRMVAMSDEGRTGERVTVDGPLATSLQVPEVPSVLRLAYGQTETTGAMSAPSRLIVELRAHGAEGPVEMLRLPESEPGRWRAREISLAMFRGRSVEVRVSVDAERGQAAWAIAELALVTGGARGPTVVFVTTDTHRGDHLGVSERNVGVRTPVLDAIAARGVVFQDCFSTTNVTGPSHIALMTGVHPRDTGIAVNGKPLNDSAHTLAERFADAGYATHAVLATHHLGHEGTGLGQGFDRMSWPPAGTRPADVVLDITERWLGEIGDVPLFLWVHVFDAHTPYEPPGAFDRMYYDGDKDPFDASLPDPVEAGLPVPADMPGLRDLEYPRAQYKAEVSYLDSQLERLFSHERVRDAVVSVVGDHGEGLGEYRTFFAHADLYPETVHVPLLLSWPGGPRGVSIDTPVSSLGLARTVLELAELDATDFPGQSLLPTIEGRVRRASPRYVLSSSRKSASVEYGGDYLILHLDDHGHQRSLAEFERHQVELFDLDEDPHCVVDLVEERSEKAAELRAALVAWLQDAAALGWAGDDVEDPEFIEGLLQLGYVQGGDEQPLWESDECAWCRRFE